MQAGAGGISAETLAGLRHSVPTLRVAVLGQQLSPEDFDALQQVRRRTAPRLVHVPRVTWTVWQIHDYTARPLQTFTRTYVTVLPCRICVKSQSCPR